MSRADPKHASCSEKEMQAIYNQADKVSQLVSGMIKYLRRLSTQKRKDAMTFRRNNAMTQ